MRTISRDPAVQAHYEQCLRAGTSETLAEMFALGCPPQPSSDTQFFAGMGDGFGRDEAGRQNALAEAKRAGVDVAGATYLPGLADFPGDPRAWVRTKGEIRQQCEAKGLHADGPNFQVNGQLYATPKPEVAPVAQDIVDEAVEQKIATDPSTRGKKYGDLRAEVRDKITPKFAKPKPFKLQRSS